MFMRVEAGVGMLTDRTRIYTRELHEMLSKSIDLPRVV